MLAIFPELSTCAKSGDLEKLSILIRTYFAGELATKPRIHALDLMKRFGIPVGLAPIKYFGAIAVKDTKGTIRASAIIRESLSPQDQAFVICHLLGHFVLHIQPLLASSEWTTSGFKEVVDPVRRYAFGSGLEGLSGQEIAAEDAADRFAGALLMPSAMVRKAMERLQHPAKVAAVFGVTSEVVERRFDDLGSTHPVESLVRAGARIATPIDVLNQVPDINSSGKEVPPEQLIRDVSHRVTSMPRAVAANSYNDAAQTEAPLKKEKDPAPLISGMDRIRELAKKMDKFGDKFKA